MATTTNRKRIADEPQWKTLHDRLVSLSVGDVITYRELQSLLPTTLWKGVIAAFHQAKKRLLNEKQLDFENVRGEGYRLIHWQSPDPVVPKGKRRPVEEAKPIKGKRIAAPVAPPAQPTSSDAALRRLEARVTRLEDTLRSLGNML